MNIIKELLKEDPWQKDRPNMNVLDCYLVSLGWDPNDADYDYATSYVTAEDFEKWVPFLIKMEEHRYDGHPGNLVPLGIVDKESGYYSDFFEDFSSVFDIPNCHGGEYHSVEINYIYYIDLKGNVHKVDYLQFRKESEEKA